MKLIKIAVMAVFTVLLYTYSSYAFGVVVFPSQLSIPSNTSSVKTLNYDIDSTGCSSITSQKGYFVTNSGRILGTINRVLSGSSPMISESITIPLNIIRQVINGHEQSFKYRRTFSCTTYTTAPPPPVSVYVTINIRNVTPPSHLGVSVSPSRISVPFNRAFVKKIDYDFNASSCINHPYSTGGEFVSDSGIILGRDSKSLTENNKQALELLNIPYGVVRKARNYKVSHFKYIRTFVCESSGGIRQQAQAQIDMNLLSKAAMPLTINRVRLYFKNKRAEISVKQNKKLTAYVDIDFFGSGMFKGYWVVDGRVLSPMIFKHLAYGKRITFKTPSIPPLPTFSYGTHFVQFVIVEPKPAFDMPKAIYFVEQKAEPVGKLMLISPKNGAVIVFKKDKPIQFMWKNVAGSDFYFVEFYESGDKKPLFSAYTVSAAYAMPPFIVKHYFKKNKEYKWLVRSFNADSEIIGKSGYGKFIIK